MTINIYQIPPGADFDPCGCGNSGNNGGNGGNVPGGTPGGGTYEGLTRLIDVCASVESIFVANVLAWIDSIQSGSISLDTLVPVEVLPLVDDVNQNLSELEQELQNPAPGLLLALKKRIVEYLPDPVPLFTRGSLRQLWVGEFPGGLGNIAALLNPTIPIVYGGAPLYAGFALWSLTANLNQVNAAMKAAKGSGDTQSGPCADLFNNIGRPIYNPPLPEGAQTGVETIEYASGNFRAYRFTVNQNLVGEALPLEGVPTDETIVTGASYDCYLTGQPGSFARQEVRYFDTAADEYRTLFKSNFGSSGDAGTWYERTVTNPAVQPFLDELYNTFGGTVRETSNYDDPPGNSAGADLPGDTALQVWDRPNPPGSTPGSWAGEIFIITEYTP